MNFNVLDKIKKMKQTLLDLKTAHLHGLGTFKFYRSSFNVPKGSNWNNYFTGQLRLFVDKSSDAPFFPPIAQLGANYSILTLTGGSVGASRIEYTFTFTPANVPSEGLLFVMFSNTPVEFNYSVDVR